MWRDLYQYEKDFLLRQFRRQSLILTVFMIPWLFAGFLGVLITLVGLMLGSFSIVSFIVFGAFLVIPLKIIGGRRSEFVKAIKKDEAKICEVVIKDFDDESYSVLVDLFVNGVTSETWVVLSMRTFLDCNFGDTILLLYPYDVSYLYYSDDDRDFDVNKLIGYTSAMLEVNR